MSQKSVGLAVKEIKLQEMRAKLVSELERIVLSVMDLDRSVFKTTIGKKRFTVVSSKISSENRNDREFDRSFRYDST